MVVSPARVNAAEGSSTPGTQIPPPGVRPGLSPKFVTLRSRTGAVLLNESLGLATRG